MKFASHFFGTLTTLQKANQQRVCVVVKQENPMKFAIHFFRTLTTMLQKANQQKSLLTNVQRQE